MEETATISLKRLKELEKYKEAFNTKATVHRSYNYGYSAVYIMSETETNNYLLEHIKGLERKIDDLLEINRTKKRWF